MRERRHADILAAAAAMIADRGFHVTRLEDIGQAVGISGPGLYRYVSGKEDLLAQILVDISVRLVDGARAVLNAARRRTGRRTVPCVSCCASTSSSPS